MARTNGGAYTQGNVQVGRDMIGRDQIIIDRLEISLSEGQSLAQQVDDSPKNSHTPPVSPQNADTSYEQPDELFNLPFGEVTCETEVARLRQQYQSFYYDQSRFNSVALDPDRYLIVGRRGSGKTSLTQYFEFQDRFRHANYICVRDLEKFFELWCQVAERSTYGFTIAIPQLDSLWEYIFWMLMFHHLRQDHPAFSIHSVSAAKSSEVQWVVTDILEHLLHESELLAHGIVSRYIEQKMRTEEFQLAQQTALKIAGKHPFLIAVDTMEKYGVHNEVLMKSTAALIQCAARFNVLYASRGIHLKVFIAAEIFPHLRESVVANTTKYIQNPLYLHWRPKDLLRLITWRFQRYLANCPPYQQYGQQNVHWEHFDHVKETMWYPFFGRFITNTMGQMEDTFPYILRHTQMRPRQIIYLCNAIARESINADRFPQLKAVDVQSIIKQAEHHLSEEVLNSYSEIYPNVAEIVAALRRSPQMFKGNYLDKVAKETASAWPERHSYSMSAFRRMVTELGIVGRVRKYDITTGIVTADFEYMIEDRLVLHSSDDCVIHPLFYAKLETQRDHQLIVYPFPDHPDFEELLQW